MTYFKVKTEASGLKLWEICKNPSNSLAPTDYFLIGGELYTSNEVVKLKIPLKYLEEIDIDENQTYFLFNTRFQKNLG